MPRRPTLRQVAVAAALAEGALLLGIAVYLLATDRALVVRFTSADERAGVGPSPRLVVPVAKVRAAELRDTWGADRSGGRAHKGVDIFAPRGTAVLAAATGIVVGRGSGGAGGTSLYVRDVDGRTVYYYAHLDRYRPGLKEGDLVRQGDVIAYVGQTGNASRPHLHFGVHVVTDPNAYHRGRDLNPYPLLRPPPR